MFVLTRFYKYGEGNIEVVGVFDDKELVQDAKNELESEKSLLSYQYEIIEYELNKVYK